MPLCYVAHTHILVYFCRLNVLFHVLNMIAYDAFMWRLKRSMEETEHLAAQNFKMHVAQTVFKDTEEHRQKKGDYIEHMQPIICSFFCCFICVVFWELVC